MNNTNIKWETIATVALTAGAAILAATGLISNSESTSLTTTGATAITGVAAFVAAIIAVVKAHKKHDDDNTPKAA